MSKRWCTRLRRRGSVTRPTTRRRGRRIRPTRSPGSSSTSRIGPAARVVDLAAGTGKLTRLLAPTGAVLSRVEPVAGMRATFRSVLPERAAARGDRRGAAVPRRRARRDRRRAGVALVRPRPRHRRSATRPHAGRRRSASCGTRATAASRWVERGVGDHGPRREARAVARPRELARQRVPRPCPGSARSRRPSSATRRPITPEGVVQRVASVSHVAVLPAAERAAVLDEVRAVLATHPTPGAATTSRSPTGSTASRWPRPDRTA